MKSVSLIIAALWILCLVFTAATANAQTATRTGRDASNRWISHQMNQPAPGSAMISSASQARMDEIRELYELAKREARAKAEAKAAGPK